MKIDKLIPIIISLIFTLISINGNSQNLSVGSIGLEDYYRRAQLLGQIDSTFSFAARPFNPAATLGIEDPFDPVGSLDTSRWNSWDGNLTFNKGRFSISLLPVSQQVAFKAPIPISMNDGPMIPARGFQSVTSGGVYVKVGPLSLRFQPEIFLAENKTYNGFPDYHSDQAWRAYYLVHNQIDLPEHFGDSPIKNYLLGQSNVKLNFGPISFGVSNENLWWGPGYRNSLLMSNSAPGFKHAIINTNKPITTAIGNFEGQLVAGRLDSSGFIAAQVDQNNPVKRFYQPKYNDWRYFNGIVLTYMPKWIPGLFLGATRAFQFYSESLQASFTNYLPVILPLQESRTDLDLEMNGGRDQLASIFIRWLLLKEQAEIYFEYGREDRSADFRDLLLDFTHSRAYIFGFRKMFSLKAARDQHIEVGFEMTQLENLRTERSLYNGMDVSWYVHSQIRHGYTHQGQMLGAGIGPGGNMQSLNISWIKGIKSIGVQLDRYVHNNDLFNNSGLDTRSHWVDIIPSGIVTWEFKNLVINAQLSGVRSYNYQWYYAPLVEPGEESDPWAHGKLVHSVQALVGVTYRF